MAERRKALGGKVCITCRGELAPKSDRYCPAHLEKHHKRCQKAYHAHAKKGLCTRCSRPAVPGKTRCEHHAAIQAAATAKWYRRTIRATKTRVRSNARDHAA